jgi:hypothetical protein
MNIFNNLNIEDRSKAFNIGDKVFYIQSNQIKSGKIKHVVIVESVDEGSEFKYKIKGQDYANSYLPHSRIASSRKELVEKIS